MTLTVNEAFRKFKSRLELNQKEQDNASAKHTEVRDYLHTKFAIEGNFLTGSYKRHTKTNRPLKKCSSNAPGSWISKKRVVQTRLRSECEGHFGLFAGRFARFGRTYPMAHA